MLELTMLIKPHFWLHALRRWKKIVFNTYYAALVLYKWHITDTWLGWESEFAYSDCDDKGKDHNKEV
jgi:hypothetical protein